MERTLILVKPDGVQRGLIGSILERFERRGLKIIGLKLMRVSRELAERHYAEHVGKGFYAGLIDYITAGPVVAAVLEGPSAIKAVRDTLGKTDPLEAAPGTIRGDFGVAKGRNLVHASDGPESAAREVALFFAPDELLSYRRDVDRWILELPEGVSSMW
ncbi:MAG: nucleoside diphosphate kinase [Dehalococcoidia bacterium]|nr:MAG: nucleoside diphosphate kinase [Dehalococcoidia bacterium]